MNIRSAEGRGSLGLVLIPKIKYYNTIIRPDERESSRIYGHT